MTNLPDERREEALAAMAQHRAGGYFATPDGHRECYCGHVMAADESCETHLADALAPLLAGWLVEAWERGHFYCAAEEGDSRCSNPYRQEQ